MRIGCRRIVLPWKLYTLKNIEVCSNWKISSFQFLQKERSKIQKMDPSELQQSPGSMHVSDLDTPPHALPRRPHKLEPLTSTVQPLHGGGSGGEGERGEEKVRKKKKTKKKKRQAEVEEETRGDLDGREGTPVREEGEDPLLGASTLQQMQARLDPLFPTSNIPPHSDGKKNSLFTAP